MRPASGAAVVLSLSLGLACGGDAVPETTPASEPNVPLATVDTATVAVPLMLAAQLYVEHDAYVYARSTGIVEAVLVDIGDRVRKGQVLARLENEDQEIALEDAQASHENAQRLLARVRELAGTGAVTVADSEQAELDARRAGLQVRQARRDYDLTRAVAPFSGVVTARTVRLGRFVEEFDPLLRVTALRPLRASVQLPEQAGAVEPGTATVVIALDGRVVEATVQRVSPIVDATSGTREVIVQLAAGSGLEPGASVHVRIGAEPRRVVLIPADAISEDGYVLVWENGRTTLRAVTVGATLEDGRLEVVSGLAFGERLRLP